MVKGKFSTKMVKVIKVIGNKENFKDMEFINTWTNQDIKGIFRMELNMVKESI